VGDRNERESEADEGMNHSEIIAALQEKFGAKVTPKTDAGFDPCVVVTPTDLVEVCRFLRDDPRLAFDVLCNISGVDYLEIDPKKAPKAGFEPHMEVVYHLQSFTHKHRFAVKVVLPRWKDDKAGELPEVPTVSGLWEIGNWHEREVYDLCGVNFTGHPELHRILLSEDWDGHPLRKDYEFPLEYHGIRGR
jgi:NADH-quinone oxidoreductase subunit C